jgi:hypothetical protein
MTTEELAAIEARANAATAGPWRGTKDEGVQADATAVFETGCECCTPSRLSEADALFIAHARTDIPALVAEVRRLKGYEEIVLKMMHERQRAMLESLGDDA